MTEAAPDLSPAGSPAAKPSPERIADTMIALATARGSDKTICPSEVARALGGAHPDGWGPLMPAVRRVAVDLMKGGQVVITRKGRPVDPDDFRGVYRIRVGEAGATEGAEAASEEMFEEAREEASEEACEEACDGPGSSMSERPDSQ